MNVESTTYNMQSACGSCFSESKKAACHAPLHCLACLAAELAAVSACWLANSRGTTVQLWYGAAAWLFLAQVCEWRGCSAALAA